MVRRKHFNCLKQQQAIQKVAAIWLLMVFAISITPKRFMHDAFADHYDGVFYQVKAAGPAVSASSINCLCDNFVAESPFINAVLPFSIASFIVHASFYNIYSLQPLQQFSVLNNGRAPPYLF